MLNDQQKKLLIRYRDMTYIMAILCSECSDFYSLINNIFKFPIILSNSIMIIFNADEYKNIKIANIILNVLTTLILSLIGNFKLNERVINFTNGNNKFSRLCHRIEDILYNTLDDDITTDNVKNIINEYDNLVESIEYPYIYHIKNKIQKKYQNNRTLPNVLNCISSDLVILDNEIISNV
jgi:hypothetical protein